MVETSINGLFSTLYFLNFNNEKILGNRFKVGVVVFTILLVDSMSTTPQWHAVLVEIICKDRNARINTALLALPYHLLIDLGWSEL